LIDDYGHHEQKVEAEGPEDDKFGAFEMAAGDVVFFGSDELVVFEGREDQGLVGGRHRTSRVEIGSLRAALEWTAEGACPYMEICAA
jgi:hypothetical protein